MGHSTKPVSRDRLEALKPFATANELECLKALIEHGSYRKAAKAMGKNDGSFSSAIRGVTKRARARGFAPEHGWNPPDARTAPANTVPDGYRMKGVSDFVDADGARKAAWLKSERATDADAHPEIPPNFLVKKVSEFTDSQGETRARWTSYSPEEVERWRLMIEAVKEACEPLIGAAATSQPPQYTDSKLLAVYGFGDPHVGMLSWGQETGADFDLKIAERQTTAVARRLVDSAPTAKIGLLALVGDNFHADDDRQVTPGHGHKLDVDSRAAKVFRLGCRLWRAVIDLMLLKHDHIVVAIAKGNHDPLTAFFLREWLAAIYANDPRVEILDNVREHLYYLFGKCLIGITHGHKTKPEGLAGVMAADVPDWWAAATAMCHWLTGHIHSKTFWRFRRCSLETLNTLAPGDSYAVGAGYRSEQNAIVITLHADFGEIARSTVNLARAGEVAA